jgi:hypothetical protein
MVLVRAGRVSAFGGVFAAVGMGRCRVEKHVAMENRGRKLVEENFELDNAHTRGLECFGHTYARFWTYLVNRFTETAAPRWTGQEVRLQDQARFGRGAFERLDHSRERNRGFHP